MCLLAKLTDCSHAFYSKLSRNTAFSPRANLASIRKECLTFLEVIIIWICDSKETFEHELPACQRSPYFRQKMTLRF